MSKSEITIDDGKYTIRTGKIKTVFRTLEEAAVMIAMCHDDIERLDGGKLVVTMEPIKENPQWLK